MSRFSLKDARDAYDVVVIGAGLAGLTAANALAQAGRSVLLLEQHYKLGGLATCFYRSGGHVFDVSLHGFPVGMVKSCRRYWSREIADSIVPLPNIRFDNPMFSLTTTFNREDFTRLMIEKFGIAAETVGEFFDTARGMNFYDDREVTTRDLFQRFFPGRDDVVRLLMEPITYANGSTLDDPALTYGIVFSNFMSKGVFTFEGGTDRLIFLMRQELLKNGVDICLGADVERIEVDASRRVTGVTVGEKSCATSSTKGVLTKDCSTKGSLTKGRLIKTRAVVSNANLKTTILDMIGPKHLDAKFVKEAEAVRLNNSSTQVYMAMRPGEMIDESCGDLLFSSTAPAFRTEMLLSRDITSRTYSFYYPKTRPGRDRCLVVSSTNSNYDDWAKLPEHEYRRSKQDLIENTLDALAKYVPDIRKKLDHVEAATPVTFKRYTKHLDGSSFGTKFEGLAVSRALPEQVAGVYHAGSVGIIMSGWLGAVNYGVIVANDVDGYLLKN